jgi:hypothetical protein
MLPEDAWWPVRLGAPDDLLRSDDEVHTEVVDGLRERLVHELERVDRGGQDRVWLNDAGLDQEGDLQVGKAPPLPMRAPWRFTATLPQTTRSTAGSSMAATFRPALAAPVRAGL